MTVLTITDKTKQISIKKAKGKKFIRIELGNEYLNIDIDEAYVLANYLSDIIEVYGKEQEAKEGDSEIQED